MNEFARKPPFVISIYSPMANNAQLVLDGKRHVLPVLWVLEPVHWVPTDALASQLAVWQESSLPASANEEYSVS